MPVQEGIKPKRYRVQHEQSVQQRLCNYLRRYYPHVIFHCDAAGFDLTDSQREKLMEMRSDDGMADLNVDFPATHLIQGKEVTFHGLRLEIKKEGVRIYKKDGKTLRKSPYTRRYYKRGKLFIKRGDHLAEQAEYLQKCNRSGYLGRFVIGYDHGVKMLDWYLGKPENESLF